MVSDLKSKDAGPGEDQAFFFGGLKGARWVDICSVDFEGFIGMAFWWRADIERAQMWIVIRVRRGVRVR